MQAADKKIIIERGADFRIAVEVNDGLFPKNIETYVPSMVIQYYDEDLDTITYLQPDGSLTGTPYQYVGTLLEDPPGINGEFEIIIDKAITALFDPQLDMEVITSRFSTQYNYFYYIEINEPGVASSSENLRLLRGKCAVRN